MRRLWLGYLAAGAALAPAAACEVAKTAAPVFDGSCECAWPQESLSARETGIVGIAFKIGVDGKVIDPVVKSSSGHKSLDDATLECTKRWHYKPAMHDGKAVEAPGYRTFEWKID